MKQNMEKIFCTVHARDSKFVGFRGRSLGPFFPLRAGGLSPKRLVYNEEKDEGSTLLMSRGVWVGWGKGSLRGFP